MFAGLIARSSVFEADSHCVVLVSLELTGLLATGS